MNALWTKSFVENALHDLDAQRAWTIRCLKQGQTRFNIEVEFIWEMIGMRGLLGPLFAVCLGSLSAFAASPEAQELIDRAAAECRSFDNGEFDAGEAVAEIELRSQFGIVIAELVDESKYACSSAASLYCGTGGCMLNLIVGGTVRSWQATGWRLIEWGPDRILLIGRDGSWCGGAGAEVCYEALVWSNGTILTVGPSPESR
ncbi:hypothetical protein [Tateyamaria pelophila]|uniref:hypothetical protein n=1 Tax=Tateyamaria pelophila TaxID=328415 RepID=UPI001CBFDCD8|nr:hypothetical protein [Tateyamaria pelophila]